MDSATQFVLGAAIGEATLKQSGSSEGQRAFTYGAALLGGLVATIPDLDVFMRPYLNGPEALAAHRGLSHSLFFCTLLSPLLAFVFQRFFAKKSLQFQRWFLFVWLTLNTHWMLDCLTTYGTQILKPFSNYPVNIGSMFIIDPVYTLTLFFGLCLSLFLGRGDRPVCARPVKLGLLLSTLYLGFSLCSKFLVLHRFQESFEQKNIVYQKMISVNTPFNCLLWYGYVDTGTDVWVSHSSLLDSPARPMLWQKIPKNNDLYPRLAQGEAGKALLWFSRGFYRLDSTDGQAHFSDLRFGRLKGWFEQQDPNGKDYLFQYQLTAQDEQGVFQDFVRSPSEGNLSQFPWGQFWSRIWGGGEKRYDDSFD